MTTRWPLFLLAALLVAGPALVAIESAQAPDTRTSVRTAPEPARTEIKADEPALKPRARPVPSQNTVKPPIPIPAPRLRRFRLPNLKFWRGKTEEKRNKPGDKSRESGFTPLGTPRSDLGPTGKTPPGPDHKAKVKNAFGAPVQDPFEITPTTERLATEYDTYGKQAEYEEVTFDNNSPDKATPLTHGLDYNSLGQIGQEKIIDHEEKPLDIVTTTVRQNTEYYIVTTTERQSTEYNAGGRVYEYQDVVTRDEGVELDITTTTGRQRTQYSTPGKPRERAAIHKISRILFDLTDTTARQARHEPQPDGADMTFTFTRPGTVKLDMTETGTRAAAPHKNTRNAMDHTITWTRPGTTVPSQDALDSTDTAMKTGRGDVQRLSFDVTLTDTRPGPAGSGLDSTDTTYKPGRRTPGLSNVQYAPNGRLIGFDYNDNGSAYGLTDVDYDEDGEVAGFTLVHKDTGKLTHVTTPPDNDEDDGKGK